ncbi:Wadjet anti-phage system protein JetD domain-containing protein [Lysobacter yangpyeongensis]|uniref:Wadjet anti-phage system protein JetD domain-containing protein n=1 Tax=Lysobacter yangpyeongensis TaxID=346182 RepID=A0ABW0SPU8_9GAMM
MRDIEEAKAFRAELDLAERKGAITVETSPRDERPRDVRAVIVANLSALAEYLNVPLRSALASHALAQLNPHLDSYPVLRLIVERWREGKKVRGEEASLGSVDDLLDAIRVMNVRQGATDELLLRRASIALFNDSKRIEALPKWLDVLMSNDLSPSGLDSHEIFSSLGLLKSPMPFLIAGDVLAVGEVGKAPLLRPYMGLPSGSVLSFEFPLEPSCVLTIENLQTFHEFSAAGTEQRGLILIYTGGMPSPAWRRMFGLLLRALPKSGVSLFHFGDVDVGGFRISKVIAQSAREFGLVLNPWLMDPDALRMMGFTLRTATTNQAAEMTRCCRDVGWDALADSIARAPGLLEQEAISPSFPTRMDCHSQ